MLFFLDLRLRTLGSEDPKVQNGPTRLRIKPGSLPIALKLKYPITFKRQPKIDFLTRASNLEKRGDKRNSQYISNGIVELNIFILC